MDNDFDGKIDLVQQYISLLVNLDQVVTPEAFEQHFQWPTNALERDKHTMEEVVSTCVRPAKYIMFQGRAGVGKTTMCQWLVRKWAAGDWAQDFTLVFLVHVRMLGHVALNFSVLTVLQLLTECSPFATTTPLILLSWLERHQERVLIVIGESGSTSQAKQS